MSGLVDGLLDISKIESGLLYLRREKSLYATRCRNLGICSAFRQTPRDLNSTLQSTAMFLKSSTEMDDGSGKS
jgi:hypothetical protein